MESEAFYEERDSRTLKLVDTADYRNKKLLIAADDDVITTLNGQVMLFMALNLAGRFCRNIHVYCNPTVETYYLPPKFEAKYFLDAMTNILRKIDPFGNFDIITNQRENYDAILSIGSSESLPEVSVTINSDGWLAFVSKGKLCFRKHYTKPNPIGAGVAACLGVAEIFKNLISRDNFTEYIENICFSALDYSVNKRDAENLSLPRKVELSKVQIIGVGAIGSAVLASLDLLPIQGEVELIDFDTIEISNLNRYLIAITEDVGRSKVSLGQNYISHHDGIVVSVFEDQYEEYVGKNGRGNSDVALPLVDNNVTRHQVQMNMPPLSIYGTTGDWAATVARHEALEDDCIICRYPNKEEEQRLPCGTIGIAQPASGQVHVNATVSFISALAGILVAGELVKRNYGRFFTHNFFQIDMGSTPHRMKHFQRYPVKECICQTPWFKRVYETILAARKKM